MARQIITLSNLYNSNYIYTIHILPEIPFYVDYSLHIMTAQSVQATFFSTTSSAIFARKHAVHDIHLLLLPQYKQNRVIISKQEQDIGQQFNRNEQNATGTVLLAVADVLPLLKNKHNNNHLEFMTIEQGKSPFLFPAPLLRFMSSNCTFIRLLSIYPLILLRCSNIVNSSNSSAIFLQVRVKIIFSIVPQFILFHFLSTRMDSSTDINNHSTFSDTI